MSGYPLPIDVEIRDGAVVARPAGEIDMANAGVLRERLHAEAVAAGAGTLVVDLTEITYIDSAGIEMLFRLHGSLDGEGVGLVVVAPPGSRAARLLSLVALGDVAEVYASVDAAVRSSARRPTG
jgi:anti-sigma B factor antagonist